MEPHTQSTLTTTTYTNISPLLYIGTMNTNYYYYFTMYLYIYFIFIISTMHDLSPGTLTLPPFPQVAVY